jgi:hypothetical protein
MNTDALSESGIVGVLIIILYAAARTVLHAL